MVLKNFGDRNLLRETIHTGRQTDNYENMIGRFRCAKVGDNKEVKLSFYRVVVRLHYCAILAFPPWKIYWKIGRRSP